MTDRFARFLHGEYFAQRGYSIKFELPHRMALIAKKSRSTFGYVFIILIVGLWYLIDRKPVIILQNSLPSVTLNLNDDISPYYYASIYQTEKSSYIPSRSGRLPYSVETFRSLSSVPILWINEFKEIHWNDAAQREMYRYLREKQTIMNGTIDEQIEECRARSFLVLQQHEAGFFSRFNCFLDQFGQTLYSPSMALLSYFRFHVSNSGKDDFRSEGILRYFVPMSTCAALDQHPKMKPIFDAIQTFPKGAKRIDSIDQLLYPTQKKMESKFIWYFDFWKYGYENVPHRRWLFDFNRAWTPIDYSLSVSELLRHDDEHIYASTNLSESDLQNWQSPTAPYGPSSIHLAGPSYKLTWQDQAFNSFLRCMIILYFHHLPRRIYRSVQVLTDHWASYIKDKDGLTFENMASIFIRRGDKMPEDTFWIKHKRWRNISYYVKALVDEEEKRKQRYPLVFVMTDDVSVMNSMIDYADPNSQGQDEQYARQHLKGRFILYNVLAPQACFNPFIRIGFDQFLTTLEFVLLYSQVTVSHRDSNVGRYIENYIYCRRQSNDSLRMRGYVVNAPDSF